MMSKLLKFPKKEVLELLPPEIFVLVVVHIAAFTRQLMVQNHSFTITYAVRHCG